MSDNLVNIGMVTYNRLYFTKQAITSLIEHTHHPHLLTVIDNNSTDGTQEYLLELYHQKVIKNLVLLDENIGVAKASNLAWVIGEEYDCDHYIKFDNDIIIKKPNWIPPLVELVNTIPKLGITGYNVEPVIPEVSKLDGYTVRRKNLNLGGACVLIPNRIKERFGYWCEDYGFYAEEDMDYGLRLLYSDVINAYAEDIYMAEHLDHSPEAKEDADYFTYFDFKHRCRHDALYILGPNKERYLKDPSSRYLSTTMNPNNIQGKLYK